MMEGEEGEVGTEEGKEGMLEANHLEYTGDYKFLEGKARREAKPSDPFQMIKTIKIIRAAVMIVAAIVAGSCCCTLLSSNALISALIEVVKSC